MNAFIEVDGRKIIEGNPIRVDVVQHSGEPGERVETILTNGRSVKVVNQDGYLRLFTGKGARGFRFSKGMLVRFFDAGVEVAVINESNLGDFASVV